MLQAAVLFFSPSELKNMDYRKAAGISCAVALIGGAGLLFASYIDGETFDLVEFQLNHENEMKAWEAQASAAGRNIDEPAPVIARQLDWSLYPGTMSDQVKSALSENNGEMAADLAAKLKECDINSRLLAMEKSRSVPSDSSPELQAIHMEQFQKYQQQIASCQTVAGDPVQVRLRLLQLAVDQKVVGAGVDSFQAGVRRADALQQVVNDAKAGDIRSLATVSMYAMDTFGIDRDTQDAARYALKIASEDPRIGRAGFSYLRMAEKFSPKLAGDRTSKFDFSGMSGSARAEGVAIAARMRERILHVSS